MKDLNVDLKIVDGVVCGLDTDPGVQMAVLMKAHVLAFRRLLTARPELQAHFHKLATAAGKDLTSNLMRHGNPRFKPATAAATTAGIDVQAKGAAIAVMNHDRFLHVTEAGRWHYLDETGDYSDTDYATRDEARSALFAYMKSLDPSPVIAVIDRG